MPVCYEAHAHDSNAEHPLEEEDVAVREEGKNRKPMYARATTKPNVTMLSRVGRRSTSSRLVNKPNESVSKNCRRPKNTEKPAFSGLLAFGIAFMNNVGGLEGWSLF